MINAKKLKFAALIMGILFLATVAIRTYTIVTIEWNINFAVFEPMV